MQYSVRIGTCDVYDQHGDKIGTFLSESIAEDMADLLNDEQDMRIDGDQKSLLEACEQHGIKEEKDLEELKEFKEKHEANEEHFGNMYEIVSNMLVLDGWRDEEIDLLNEMAELLKQVDVKPNTKKKKTDIDKLISKAHQAEGDRQEVVDERKSTKMLAELTAFIKKYEEKQ